VIRHATGKKMILEQIAKTQSFAKRLGYLQGATIFCGGVMIICIAARTIWK
jgi:hypothetical protein